MKQFAKVIFVATTVMLSTVTILAHGVRIDHVVDTVSGEITIIAVFDTGEVLDEAAVVIFAPNDLINPWSTGVMDESGAYTFTPDYTIEGFWDIQVRKAGHGGLINVEITADMIPDEDNVTSLSGIEGNSSTITLSDGSQVMITGNVDFNVNGDTVIFETQPSTNISESSIIQPAIDMPRNSGFTSAQIVIMSLSVIWGFVGTALYFMRRKPKLES